jgi:hypothetical protein
MEITYWPRYAYAEIPTPFVDTSGAEGTSKSLLSEIEKLARMVVYGPGDNPAKEKLRAPEVVPDEQLAISRQYAFDDSGPASRMVKHLMPATRSYCTTFIQQFSF